MTGIFIGFFFFYTLVDVMNLKNRLIPSSLLLPERMKEGF